MKIFKSTRKLKTGTMNTCKLCTKILHLLTFYHMDLSFTLSCHPSDTLRTRTFFYITIYIKIFRKFNIYLNVFFNIHSIFSHDPNNILCNCFWLFFVFSMFLFCFDFKMQSRITHWIYWFPSLFSISNTDTLRLQA